MRGIDERIDHVEPFHIDDFAISLSQEYETLYGFQLPPTHEIPLPKSTYPDPSNTAVGRAFV